ncbi:hypothetical protein I4F81_008203 [Pyropia yezoensis]|uniref:Uncharacterized protein n=2 Tax=Pyropia yezoensis TaxID=2788 RepID=A0ACC3C6U3_PYRYE|nr:hypothetical protein I4F81_008203 [Neopyropia yezoensis]KAK1865675.1 hypothetical protein I4F81_008203 [Neopyropia yezoensis]
MFMLNPCIFCVYASFIPISFKGDGKKSAWSPFSRPSITLGSLGSAFVSRAVITSLFASAAITRVSGAIADTCQALPRNLMGIRESARQRRWALAPRRSTSSDRHPCSLRAARATRSLELLLPALPTWVHTARTASSPPPRRCWRRRRSRRRPPRRQSSAAARRHRSARRPRRLRPWGTPPPASPPPIDAADAADAAAALATGAPPRPDDADADAAAATAAAAALFPTQIAVLPTWKVGDDGDGLGRGGDGGGPAVSAPPSGGPAAAAAAAAAATPRRRPAGAPSVPSILRRRRRGTSSGPSRASIPSTRCRWTCGCACATRACRARRACGGKESGWGGGGGAPAVSRRCPPLSRGGPRPPPVPPPPPPPPPVAFPISVSLPAPPCRATRCTLLRPAAHRIDLVYPRLRR